MKPELQHNIMNIQKIITVTAFISIFSYSLTSQEALKSIEEEYYDFLSLTGVVERPTLGYRTLSDSVWKFNEVETFEENEDGTFTKVRVPGQESDEHIWKKNNLGTTYTLWEPAADADNWFVRGVKQGLTVRVYGPEWFNSYNQNAPYGFNDGALWQGRGYNTSLTAGLRLEGYGFELTFKPQISFSQNISFYVNENIYPSPYLYSFKNRTVYNQIDLIQRNGDEAFWNLDLGDTEIRWTFYNITLGFGTQNPWLGPAYINPMLGSNNAPGYLKLDAGLRKTEIIIPFINLNLGSIEGRLWIGQLEESNFFDNDETNNLRMLNAMSASYAPSFIPGLKIGLNRVFMTYWKPENFKYFLRLFTTSSSNALAISGNDEDQKFSLFAEWLFPKIGFSVYGEFGRDDFSYNEKSIPFHSAIYTIGIKQAIPIKLTYFFPKLNSLFNVNTELVIEWNNFELSQDFFYQWPYMGFYQHGFVKQGYTHKGQSLGAGTGWAGNSQFIQYKIYHKYGFFSFHFHRHCPDNNSIYSMAINENANNGNSELFDQWYSNNQAYFDLGFDINLFLFQNLNLDFSYSDIPIYNHYNKGYERIPRFTWLIKYNF